MLNAEQVERYRWDGYLFPLPALSADELRECNAGLARFEAWHGVPLTAADKKWRSASYVFLPWVAALVRHSRILEAVESVIGPDILVTPVRFLSRRRGRRPLPPGIRMRLILGSTRTSMSPPEWR